MKKNELWSLYKLVQNRLTAEEKKLIEATKPGLLKATERELAIHLGTKFVLIISIIRDSASLRAS